MMGILPGLGKVYTVEKRAGRLVPTPSWLQDLVTMYDKMECKGVMNIITWSVAQALHFVTLVCIAMLLRRPILRSVLSMNTSADGERHQHIRARRHSSKGLLNDMCEMSVVTECYSSGKEVGHSFDLQHSQRKRLSVVFCLQLQRN